MSRFRRQSWLIVPLVAGLLLGDGPSAACGGPGGDCVSDAVCCRSGDEACCRPESAGLTCDLLPAPLTPRSLELDDRSGLPFGDCPCEARSSPWPGDEPSSWSRLLRPGRAAGPLLAAILAPDRPALTVVATAAAESQGPDHTPAYLRHARLRC